MPEGKVMTRNRVPALRRKWNKGVQKKLNGLALSGRDQCKDEIESGSAGITSDTGAMAASFYMESATWKGGYGKALSAMLDAYATRYPIEHGMERIAPPREIGIKQVVFGSTSKVFSYWEYGHQNKFTGAFEKAPVLRPVREQIKKRAAVAFRGLLREP